MYGAMMNGTSMESFDLYALRSQGSVPDHVKPMVDAVGKLFMNCGLLENLCKSAVIDLEQDEDERIRICNLQWNNRSSSLISLIRKHISEHDLQIQVIRVIEKIQNLMLNSRNPIAHGLVIYKKEKEEMVIVDTKFRKNTETGEMEATNKGIGLSEIRQRVDESAELIDEWDNMWRPIKETRESSL